MVSKNQSDVLPPGWNLQTKLINGRKYKYYINTTTHQKFYSKLAMLRYINNGCPSNETKKTSANNQMQLVQANDYEWLPPGWVVERRVRKSGALIGMVYKCFIEPSTGRQFFSKPEVLRYLGSEQYSSGSSRGRNKERTGNSSGKYIKDGCISNEKIQHIDKHTETTSEKNKMQLVQSNDYEWLPTGWVIQRKIRKSGPKVGMKYKCFVDPSTGSKFSSKPEVLRYLESKQSSAGGYSSSKRSIDSLNDDIANLEAKVSQIAATPVHNGRFSEKPKIVVEKTVDEDLPSGWIKETRIKLYGDGRVRKDPFYADSASGLVFRSKLEALRYVESGEISRHAYRRKYGNINGENIAIEDHFESWLKRIDDSDFEEVNHQMIDGDEKSMLGIQVEQSFNKIESPLTSFEEDCQRLDQDDTKIILASQEVPYYKIDDLPLQEVMYHPTLDFDAKTVSATQGEPSSKIDDLQTKTQILVDLNVLQLETPHGFSENAKFGASAIITKQSVEHPVDTFSGSKAENSSKGKSTLEDKPREQLVNTEKQTEQLDPELCSLWSDPCLEFAFKTLTGEIPFDDNLVIEDYIQHKLSIPEQNLDIGTPSFYRKDESKLASQSQEDVNFLNYSSFGSRRNKPGKK